MAEIFTIDIEFNAFDREIAPETRKLLTIPQISRVPKGAIVQWNIRNLFLHLTGNHSLIFTLYFENKSPFVWKRTFIQSFQGDYSPVHSGLLRLAEDVADKTGDFKYGVSVFDVDRNEPIYDEDPLLRVF